MLKKAVLILLPCLLIALAFLFYPSHSAIQNTETYKNIEAQIEIIALNPDAISDPDAEKSIRRNREAVENILSLCDGWNKKTDEVIDCLIAYTEAHKDNSGNFTFRSIIADTIRANIKVGGSLFEISD